MLSSVCATPHLQKTDFDEFRVGGKTVAGVGARQETLAPVEIILIHYSSILLIRYTHCQDNVIDNLSLSLTHVIL